MQTSINPPAVLFWAIIRMVLGIAQMTGGIATAVLLFRLGAAAETVVALSITMGVTVLSILLFRVLKLHEKGPS